VIVCVCVFLSLALFPSLSLFRSLSRSLSPRFLCLSLVPSPSHPRSLSLSLARSLTLSLSCSLSPSLACWLSPSCLESVVDLPHAKLEHYVGLVRKFNATALVQVMTHMPYAYAYAAYACLILRLTCMPRTHALYVCLICMPYMYALYVCLICMQHVYDMCLRYGCLPCMAALYFCLVCLPYMYDRSWASSSRGTSRPARIRQSPSTNCTTPTHTYNAYTQGMHDAYT